MKLPEFKLERYFSKHEFSAPYLLCCSDCQTLSLGELLDMEEGAADRFMKLGLGYTEAPGAESLRREIAGLYEGLGPENILVHAGAEEAIFAFMNVILEPGDHVIVQWPCYQSLFQIADGLGCRVSLWKMDPQNQWALSLEDLDQALRPDTKAIIINSPHNPTGQTLGPEFYKRLAALAEERGLLIFSDEVYRLLEYDESDRPAPFCVRADRAVSLGVMSKAFGLAGLRIGWIAAQDRQLLARMAAFKDYLTICNSAPSEFLAETALRNRDRILARTRGIIEKNLGLLDDFFIRHSGVMRWTRPQAGPIGFPELIGPEDAESFSRRLLDKTGVLLLPGRMYGEDFNRFFRLGFGRIDLAEGLARLDGFLYAGAK